MLDRCKLILCNATHCFCDRFKPHKLFADLLEMMFLRGGRVLIVVILIKMLYRKPCFIFGFDSSCKNHMPFVLCCRTCAGEM